MDPKFEGGRTITLDAAGNVRSVEVEETRERLNRLAWLLDSSIPIPGTRFSIGLDAIIGLVPVVGDFIGVLLSSYILKEAARLGVPGIVLARMAFNIAVEGVIGVVPVVGDVFDAAWKANQRNVRVLYDWLDRPRRTERASKLLGALLLFVVVQVLALIGIGGYFALSWLVQRVHF